jgi:hypothetical protein
MSRLDELEERELNADNVPLLEYTIDPVEIADASFQRPKGIPKEVVQFSSTLNFYRTTISW